MKKTILVAALIVFGLAGYAQTAQSTTTKTPEERAQRFTDWIDKTVQLTPDQKAKVQVVNVKYAGMKQEVRTAENGDRKAMRQDLMTDNKEQDAELKGILTADQYTAYAAAKKQKMEDMRSRRKGTK